MNLDEKIAAARALGKFRGDPRVTEALAAVLRDEKDVALRNNATKALQEITGKKHGSDFKAWDEELHSRGASEPNRQPAKPEKAADEKPSKFLGLF